MSSLSSILAEGFFQYSLLRIAEQSYTELATYPVASVVVAHVCRTIAAHWDSRPVSTGEVEITRELIEPSLKKLLNACAADDQPAIETATLELAEAFFGWLNA